MRKPRMIPIVLIALIALSACSAPKVDPLPEDKPSEEKRTDLSFVDSLGHAVQLDKTPHRVAALSGSYAETWLLAGGEAPVAVTEDAYSERGLDLPEDTALAGTVHAPDLEAVLAARPDLVLLSADSDSHLKLESALSGAKIPHAYFKVDTFEDYLSMLKICTDLTGRADLYEQNGAQIEQRTLDAIASVQGREPPRVLYLRAYSSGVKAKGSDSIAGAILSDLGAVNLAEEQNSLLEDLQMESIVAADPDFILVTTMGSDEIKALEQLNAQFASNPAWHALSAVKNGHYTVLPKELFHYKPNVRWGESYEMLAELLYGDGQNARP